jgi:polar amino acid transport system substrate-binding protein
MRVRIFFAMLSRHRLLHALSGAFLFCILLGSCSDKNRTQKLIIGMDASYPPFEMKDPGGEFTGVSADLGRAVAKDLGRTADIRNIPFDGLIAALKSGEIDCVISSMTANDERRQSIDFSDPYVKIGLALLVSAKSNVQTADELKAAGRRIAVKLGTTGEAYARKNFPGATLLSLSEDSACAMEVVKGGVDAWIYDQLSVVRYHEKNPESTRALLKPLSEETWAIGFRKGNDALREQTNAFLKKFHEGGGFDKLGDKYLADFKSKLKAQGVPFVFDL